MTPSVQSLIAAGPAAFLTGWNAALIVLLIVLVCAEATLLAILLGERRRSRQADLQQQRVKESLVEFSRNAEMRQLASTLAHDLAQPLAAVLTNAQAAARLAAAAPPDLPEVQSALADLIDDHNQVREVLQRARFMYSKPVVNLHPVNLNLIAEQAAGLAREKADQHEVKLRLALSAQPFVVLADEEPLRMVVWNLLSNAIDVSISAPTDQRVVTLSTEVDHETGQGCLTVEDMGPGIPEERLSRLFKLVPTMQPQSPAFRLAVCGYVLGELGGSISAKNRAAQGATFRVALPLAG
jgi:C4-dicarboxylate-specific signal transduction histidine kinase